MDFRAIGLRQPIIISPNGIDMPVLGKLEQPAYDKPRMLLFLARLHDKKGLDMLLKVWARLAPDYPDWRLRIVGKGDKAFSSNLAQQLAKLPRAVLEGPLYGDAKVKAMASADLFVLPTRGENFGMVVAEALAAETPVVTTRGAPWGGLIEHDAGWWVDADIGGIEYGLRQAMSCTRADLADRGARGRKWMDAAFGWDAIGATMAECYQWLLTGGDRPSAVVTE